MSQFRAYFYDLTTRKELVDHPSNGKYWCGISGMYHDGKDFVPDTCTSVTVADFASLSSVKGERRVTRADFTGPVAVKVWFRPKDAPGTGPHVEWRKLVDEEGKP